ncbi:hypothetical protein [Streptomyces sp. NPDC047123]|uniref:hypothetical protein n=1 Tax=Streptomyces sp. NPDC047123 TaxID=3155622 RepID=UPI0033C41672
MSADPVAEPSMPPKQDPIELLIAFEEASEVPTRPEHLAGMGIVPPQPDDEHHHETDTGPKYRSCAAAGVPVSVLLHRRQGKAFALTDPVRGDDPATAHSATKVEAELGHRLPLPAPCPSLDTVFLLEDQPPFPARRQPPNAPRATPRPRR